MVEATYYVEIGGTKTLPDEEYNRLFDMLEERSEMIKEKFLRLYLHPELLDNPYARMYMHQTRDCISANNLSIKHQLFNEAEETFHLIEEHFPQLHCYLESDNWTPPGGKPHNRRYFEHLPVPEKV